MKLYKFKSLENFEYVADIIMNKKLYAAEFTELNDPNEGVFTSYDKEEFINAIKDEKSKLRVCSMAQDYYNPLLWAHYANSYRGICIEFEIDNDSVEFEKVNYSEVTAIASRGPVFSGFSNGGEPIHSEYSTKEWAKIILTNKFREWNYEEEVRLFSDKKFIIHGIEITGIYLGLRVSDIYKDILEKISNDIPINHTEINSLNQVVKKSNA